MTNRRHVSRPDPLRLAPAVLGLGLVVMLVGVWASSRLGEYSVMTMGHVVDGRGGEAVPAGGHEHGAGGAGAAVATLVDVRSLVADPARPADVRAELVAQQGRVTVEGGRAVDGYTVNGRSPGPTLRATQGDLVEVVLVNESVADGVTLHWHGVDVPNAADGVAGITQDAVQVGGRFTYRFVATDAGTYWYHSHQVSHEQVVGGLLGALVVEPQGGVAEAVDAVAVLHVYGGQHTLGGSARDLRVDAAPGARARIRVINTDQGTAAVWSAAPFRVLAVDGHEVNRPTPVTGRKVLVAAGGRADVEASVPATGAVRLHVGGARSVVVGPTSTPEPTAVAAPRESLDLLAYGSPVGGDLGVDPSRPDRRFDYVIGRRLGLLDGRPGMFWTVNGRMFPDVPMFHVATGDVVVVRIVNDSAEVHPMHLHGHHAVVLSRDGVAASGAPWVVDSLDVHPGEAYEIAFVADNPGIWADHCHTLQHAVDGLLAHVMYEGVTTPFVINGSDANHPE